MNPQPPPPGKGISNTTVILALGITLLVGVTCSLTAWLVARDSDRRAAPAEQADNGPLRGTPTPPAPAGNFSPQAVCTLPQLVAPNTPYARLGGGSWGQWDSSGGELAYGCVGDNDYIKLVDSDYVQITAEYGAIGAREVVHYITAEYMATQYMGQTAEERKQRTQYADFCDRISEKLYGQKLPLKFRKRLLDESTYSDTGMANEYAEKAGSGYVNLSSNRNKSLSYMLDVHFFSSEEEYNKYKDE